jgi:hypothetical protein
MRPAVYIPALVALATGIAQGATGYLRVVGPKPLVFATPVSPGVLAAAIAGLPPLAMRTPIPPNADTNSAPVIVTTPDARKPAEAPGAPGAADGQQTLTASSTPSAAEPVASPGAALTGQPTVAPHTSGHDPLLPLVPGDAPSGSGQPPLPPWLSPQMLVPFFLTPGATNRATVIGPLYFQPGRPQPAASSTATYQQH